jgi:hypothetical protein
MDRTVKDTQVLVGDKSGVGELKTFGEGAGEYSLRGGQTGDVCGEEEVSEEEKLQ